MLCTDSLSKTQAASALKLRTGNTNRPKARSKGCFEYAHPQSSTAVGVLGGKSYKVPLCLPFCAHHLPPLGGAGLWAASVVLTPPPLPCASARVHAYNREKVACGRQHYFSCNKMEGSLPGTETITCQFPLPIEWMQ